MGSIVSSGRYTLHEYSDTLFTSGMYEQYMLSYRSLYNHRYASSESKVPQMAFKSSESAKYMLLAGSIVANLYCSNANAKSVNFAVCDAEVVSNYMGLVDQPYRKSISKYIKRRDKGEVIVEILSFKSLQNSWDGYGAVPVQIKSAANAIEIVNNLSSDSLDKISDIFPNPNGTISFQWENVAEEIISLEVGDHTFSYYVEMNSSETLYFNDVRATPEEIKNLDKYVRAV